MTIRPTYRKGDNEKREGREKEEEEERNREVLIV